MEIESSLSLFEFLPVVGYIQSKFDVLKGAKWLENNFHIPVIASCIYIMFVFSGKKWMADRKPYNLKRVLFLWNVLLAVFSIIGSISLAPYLAVAVYRFRLPYTVCRSEGTLNPHIFIWGFVFVLSKIVEFGDTVFLILRKRPIMFLHWYHHITVLLFSWHLLGGLATGLGHWFCCVNYIVHSVMYTYYAIVSTGIRLPANIAQMITILQLVQMFIGISLNVIIYFYRNHFDICDYIPTVFWSGLLMYASYFVLFAQYFYNRYIRK